jgi:hypothetical protein
VVSVVPANLAAGVTSNSSIKITFSEMMNPATVASALSVSSFTSANLTLSWDATGRILTITPANGLAYATGTSPATTTATSYTVSLKATATDIAGNSLSAFTSSFSTLRRINQTLSPTSIGSFNSYGWAIGDGPTLCPATDPVPLYSYVGLAISATYTAYLAFDTTPLGSPAEITAFESAALIGVQNSPKGDFYAKHRIYASKLQYHAVDRDAYSSPVTDDLGAFATSAATMASVSILGPFKTDVASGNRLQLYRLEPTGDADSTESYFTCAGFALKVTFLSP